MITGIEKTQYFLRKLRSRILSLDYGNFLFFFKLSDIILICFHLMRWLFKRKNKKENDGRKCRGDCGELTAESASVLFSFKKGHGPMGHAFRSGKENRILRWFAEAQYWCHKSTALWGGKPFKKKLPFSASHETKCMLYQCIFFAFPFRLKNFSSR